MSQKLEKELYSILLNELSDGFNRSLMALESAGAIDTSSMKSKCKGVGSEYYDLVTAQLEYTARHATGLISTTIAENNNDPQVQKRDAT